VASERELRKRIRSVKNIGQVTRALEAVSASKVRRAQAQVLATRPYSTKAWQILIHVSAQGGVLSDLHPLLEVRPEIKSGTVILFTSDRGLCGAFNTNIARKALDFARTSPWPVSFVSVGRKGRDILYRTRQHIEAEFANIPDNPSILDITPVARTVMDDFLSRRVDVVYLAYMDFVNTLIQRPVVKRLLPLKPSLAEDQAVAEYLEDGPADGRGQTEFLYEPSPAAILNEILPRFTELQIYQAALESVASEHSARMVAMRNATENAAALVDELTLLRNRVRQAGITAELLDISGGVEAQAQTRPQQRVVAP
jgi:F-type H+-transporting ATPase subunit gamma